MLNGFCLLLCGRSFAKAASYVPEKAQRWHNRRQLAPVTDLKLLEGVAALEFIKNFRQGSRIGRLLHQVVWIKKWSTGSITFQVEWVPNSNEAVSPGPNSKIWPLSSVMRRTPSTMTKVSSAAK